MKEQSVYEKIGKEIGELVQSKNTAYDNSLNSVGDMLRILFPGKIPPEKYHIVSVLVRMLDKIKRLAANPNDMESFKDLAGYSILCLGQNETARANDESLLELANKLFKSGV